jgi:hypothetical protein
MSKIEDAKTILKDLGLPVAQQNEISAFIPSSPFVGLGQEIPGAKQQGKA